MNIVIAGGTGFLGRYVVARLVDEGHHLTILTRNPERSRPSPMVEFAGWDGTNSKAITPFVDGADAVINLAGASIGSGRWTPVRKKLIVDSRIGSTRAIVAAISSAKKAPRVLVNASAVGIYGNRGDEELTETSPDGKGFLADVVRMWEQEASGVSASGVRWVALRFGIILGHGGALSRMSIPFLFFLGGPIGSGRQWISWIQIEDVWRVVSLAINREDLCGPINVVAPQSVRMSEFCHVLASVLNRPSWLSVPSTLLRLGMGEMADLVLDSQLVLPSILHSIGYSFQYGQLHPALSTSLRS